MSNCLSRAPLSEAFDAMQLKARYEARLREELDNISTGLIAEGIEVPHNATKEVLFEIVQRFLTHAKDTPDI